MRELKKKLKLWLCIVVVLTVTVTVLPQNAAAAQTSKPRLSFYEDELWVMEGEKEFYVGDLIKVDIYSEINTSLSQKSDAAYKSSKTSVATVDKNTGKLTAKKRGTTTIEAKYKDVTVKIKLKVVSRKEMEKALKKIDGGSSLGCEWKYLAEYKKEAKEFLKNAGVSTNKIKITSSNRYKLLSAYKRYNMGSLGYSDDYTDDKWEKRICYMFCGEALHAYTIRTSISNYCDELDPFHSPESLEYKNSFRVKSMSGKSGSKTIKLKLEQKVTANQIFGAYYHYSWDTDIKKTKTYTFPIMVQNQKSGYKYYAVAGIKEGSDIMTIEMDHYKLEKNVKYRLALGCHSIAWYGMYSGPFTAK